MTDDIDALVEWQLHDSPAALKQFPLTPHRRSAGLALPPGICPHYAYDSRVVEVEGSGQ